MTDPIRVGIGDHSGSYSVHIAEGLSARLGTLLRECGLGSELFVVSSPLVWKLHGAIVREALPAATVILIPDGERFKHLATVSRIYDALLRAEADRSAAIVAVGGGVVGDVAGFAAATYLRGLGLAYVPTTLLAQVDSAIGGKVGVNHPLGKNLIGAFYPPAVVAIDPQLLRTLPRREFRAGLYEVVKYGVIASRPLFDRLNQQLSRVFARESAALLPIIEQCCRIKAAVVSADERETGPRRVLNFGHTAGHALEAITNYRRFRHGEAVAFGMLTAAEIAVGRRVLTETDRDELADLITRMGPLPPIGDLSAKETVQAMRRDKKIARGVLHFVLPTSLGATTIVNDVSEKELARALKKIGLKG